MKNDFGENSIELGRIFFIVITLLYRQKRT